MECLILHESKNRLRVHVNQEYMTFKQADIWEYYLKQIEGVTSVKVFDRTCNIVVCFNTSKDKIIEAFSKFHYGVKIDNPLILEQSLRGISREYEDKLVSAILKKGLSMLFMPSGLRVYNLSIKALKHIHRGLSSLLKGKIEVSVLDATAIGVSMLTKDYSTASSIMFLLKVGEILEEWTHKKTVGDLARTMSLNVEKVWLLVDGQEVLVSINEIKEKDQIVVRTGNMIPMDGKVVKGDASVNQASITGEPLPVSKAEGSYVYAGTVVVEGDFVISVDKVSGKGRYDAIVNMIEESEKLKSMVEHRYSSLADKLVPYSLGGTLLTYLVTGNITKAISILMVDFSCALKLAMPISVLSAMNESTKYGITVKGGKFLEAVSMADTIVLDKTGTLTHAFPKVVSVIPFNGKDENEMLRLAACLEEHYPHSMANAVVEEAKTRGLNHDEKHSKINYVVAHGISSEVDGEQVIIGSHHFVFQDEGCEINEQEQAIFDSLPAQYSHLYMAISKKLVAVILIEDPIRKEASSVIESLHDLGIKNVVMITGDNKKTAQSVARAVGVDEFYAEVLPEDKANFIKKQHELGKVVIMVGDGVNDAPALSESDAGIAISDGAPLAREIADITISADNLNSLVTLKKISDGLMNRINQNYNDIIGFNAGLIVLGVFGVLPPATSALLHNVSTIGISLRSMNKLLD